MLNLTQPIFFLMPLKSLFVFQIQYRSLAYLWIFFYVNCVLFIVVLTKKNFFFFFFFLQKTKKKKKIKRGGGGGGGRGIFSIRYTDQKLNDILFGQSVNGEKLPTTAVIRTTKVTLVDIKLSFCCKAEIWFPEPIYLKVTM